MKGCLLACGALIVLSFARSLAAEQVWRGDVRIDSDVLIDAGDLCITKGARVTFVGNGRLEVCAGRLVAEGVEFIAESIVTNAFRVCVRNGDIVLQSCILRGIRSVAPVKGVSFRMGAISAQGGGACRLAGNLFLGCSAVEFVNARHAVCEMNDFRFGDRCLSLLNCADAEIVRNVFRNAKTEGLRLNGAKCADVSANRFIDCHIGMFAQASSRGRMDANSFFGGGRGIVSWNDDRENSYTANLFEDLSGAAFSTQGERGSGSVWANNVICRCGSGFVFGKTDRGERAVVRNNAIVWTGVGMSDPDGTVEASFNACWQVAKPTSAGLPGRIAFSVTGNPQFRDAGRSDYRLQAKSPLRNAGYSGVSIGLFR